MTTETLIDRELTTQAAAAPASTAPAAPRFDMYVSIHKALRSLMCDTLLRAGRMDVHDPADLAAALEQIDTLLTSCLDHIDHENTFVHTAIEARRPAGARHTADDHIGHLESIAALRGDVAALRVATPSSRSTLAHKLYHHLALFVAENFQHMHVEETANNAALWALYSDAELIEIHDRLLATIPPAKELQIMRWMIPASSPMERAIVLGHVKTMTPPEAFLGVLAVVRPHLDDIGWTKLAPALGVPVLTFPAR
ncbi:MAG TPA: hypothetical protein VJO99_22860 [Burkholderiaceae bacterium]|nr:hypothetical protein [Burkholderiaceae bacterium]